LVPEASTSSLPDEPGDGKWQAPGSTADEGVLSPVLRSAGPARQLSRYQLLEELGRGGMGIVYRARHIRLGKIVALKVLSADGVRSAAASVRFQREQEAIGKLDHPHLVRAMDADEAEGMPFLVMEFCDGKDLSWLLRQHRRLPVADACELARQAALGLQHAHEHGLVHRDVKPSNVMLTRAGLVKVLDLGLALLRGGAMDEKLTQTGGIMGTYDYMAPEQASESHDVDIRADVYSLGCTLYCLLTGRPPFADSRRALDKIRAHAEAPVPPIRQLRPEVPEALAEVVQRMLAKQPHHRFATAGEVAIGLLPFTSASDLQKLLACEAAPESPPLPANDGPAKPSPRPPRSRRSLLVRLGVAAALAALGGLVLFLTWPHAPSLALKELRFTVRRSNDDKQLFYLDLVREGASQEPEPIDPPLRAAVDDFRLIGQLTRPAYWYVLWIDTAGTVKVEGLSQGAQAEVRYPSRADRMVRVSPADPPGVHLLLLVAGSISSPDAEGQLEGRLQDIGPPPFAVPRRWHCQLRGAGGERLAPPDDAFSGYLEGIEKRMPAGLYAMHYLLLPVEK
jgi:serine/threonine protein kinase